MWNMWMQTRYNFEKHFAKKTNHIFFNIWLKQLGLCWKKKNIPVLRRLRTEVELFKPYLFVSV